MNEYCDGCGSHVDDVEECPLCGQGPYCIANNDCLHDHYTWHCDEGEHQFVNGACIICYKKEKMTNG